MSVPGFDDSRILDYPDKKLLENIRAYYRPFINGDADAQKALQTEDFVITDVPLGFIRIPRDQWHAINSSFTSLLTNLHITAYKLYGSSKPGEFSLLEHLTEVTLAADPPPGAAELLPPGAKKGDRVGMVDLDVTWWTEDGKLSRQLVYGRMAWPSFDPSQFDPPK